MFKISFWKPRLQRSKLSFIFYYVLFAFVNSITLNEVRASIKENKNSNAMVIIFLQLWSSRVARQLGACSQLAIQWYTVCICMQSADGVFYHRADILHSILEKLKLPLFSPLANPITIVIDEFHFKISTEQLLTAISRIFHLIMDFFCRLRH